MMVKILINKLTKSRVGNGTTMDRPTAGLRRMRKQNSMHNKNVNA